MNQLVVPAGLIAQGKQLHRQGRLEEAERIYRQVLADDPVNADALHLLGVIANQRGDHAQAVSLIGKAISRSPESEHFHCNLGLAHLGAGDVAAAEKCFSEELARYPASFAALANYGALLQKKGAVQQAVTYYQAALTHEPDDVTVLNNLGYALMDCRDFEAAWAAAQKSLSLRADNPDAYNVLGLVCRHQGKAEQALAYYSEALKYKSDSAEIYSNIGVAHKDLAEFEQALNFFELALKLKPDYPVPHFSRGTMLLAQGEFAAGWLEYEYGLLCGERVACKDDCPRWQGETLAHRTILLCAEQGLGDEIMFASVVPEIIAEAEHCIVECHPKLVPIYQRSFPTATILPRNMPGQAGTRKLPRRIDRQCPVGSLPRYRRNRLAEFPRHTGYLRASPERVADWKAKLNAFGPGLKVGISWRGGVPKTGQDRRSIQLRDWLPILRKSGMHCVSLQYTQCHEEIAKLERMDGIVLPHWQAAIDDYDETAALVCALDVIVTVQTALFHLTGALGRPVWGLIPSHPEWRYMLRGNSLPWYPSARLFRQTVPGEWDEVLQRVATELDGLSG